MNSWEDQKIIPPFALHDEYALAGFFGEYRFLSNFWPAEVELKGLTFKSTEVAYQAAKCRKEKDMNRFIELDSTQSKRLGRHLIEYGIEFDPKWEERKESLMGYLVMQKFSRHPELRKKLLDTQAKTLTESNSWNDRFWGVAHYLNSQGNWISRGGENHLGQILMRTRNILKIV